MLRRAAHPLVADTGKCPTDVCLVNGRLAVCCSRDVGFVSSVYLVRLITEIIKTNTPANDTRALE